MTDTLVLKNTKFTKGLVMPKKGTYLELDQDEMEYVDGGIIQVVGACATVISLTCTAILYLNKYKRCGIPFWGVILLNLTRVVGNIVGLVCGMSSSAIASGISKTALSVLSKVGVSSGKAVEFLNVIKACITGANAANLLCSMNSAI